MRKFASLVAMIGLLSAVSFAGVAKESYKAGKFAVKESKPVVVPVAKVVSYPGRHPKKSAKHAAHYSVKAGKVAKKVLY